MTTVSTIIPAYNAAAYLAHAVDSALAQTDVDNEVIVIDDGSTDRTWEILQGYGERIRAVRQANAGHVRARNRAAEMARGDWLAFLDADDEWLPTKLSSQLALADAETAMVYTDRSNIGEIARIAPRQSDSVRLFEGDIFEPLLFDNFITVSSVMLRKSWFDRVGHFDADPWGCEDWDLWLRLSAEGGRVKVCREPLTRYRWHAASMTSNFQRMHDGRRKVVQRALKLRKVSPAIERRAMASAMATAAWVAAPAQPWTALGWYLQAAWRCPGQLSYYKEMLKCLLRRP